MWSKLTGKSDTSSQDGRKKPDSASARRRAESVVSSTSTRRPARTEDRPAPSSRHSFPPPESVASSYATAPDQYRSSYDIMAPTDSSARSRGGYEDRYDDDTRSVRSERKRRDRSSSRDRTRRKDRSRSRDRDDKKKEAKKKKDKEELSKKGRKSRDGSKSEDGHSRTKSSIVSPPDEAGTRGMDSFQSQIMNPGFSPFPGQVGAPTASPLPPQMSPHIADQFPGQNPAAFSTPFVAGPNYGAAAEYYGDQGQSVQLQPGVRPQQPLVNAQPHLSTPTATSLPPLETGNGSAADFYGPSGPDPAVSHTMPGSFDDAPPSKPPRPSSKPGKSGKTEKPEKPSKFDIVAGTAGGAALGYALGHTSSNHHQSHTMDGTQSTTFYQQGVNPSAYAASTTANMGDHYYQNSTPLATGIDDPGYSSSSKPPRPGKYSSDSNIPVYSAGAAAAGLAAGAYGAYQNASHTHSHTHTHTLPGLPGSFPQSGGQYGPYAASPAPSMTMRMRHEHKGPVTKFVDWWKDYEDVAKMEAYTEAIGVCRGCFDPHSSAKDAPRKHHYRRKRSFESRTSGEARRSSELRSGRVDKESRYYYSSDNESRRKNKADGSSWFAAGLAGYGLAKAGKSLFNKRDDFDDTYSVKSGRTYRSTKSTHRRDRSRSHSRDRKDHKLRTSGAFVRPRSRSPDRLSTGITSTDRKDYKIVKHRSRSRSRSRERRDEKQYKIVRHKSRSRSRSRDRKSGLFTAAVGASAVAAAASHARKRSRSRSRSPQGAFVRHSHSHRTHHGNGSSIGFGYSGSRKHTSRQSSSVVDISQPHRVPSNTGLFSGFFAAPEKHDRREKSHRVHRKKKKGFFNFSNSSSSSSDDGLAYGAGFDRRRSSKAKRRNSDEKLNAALLGLGATTAALAAAQASKRGSRSSSHRKPELVAVRESKGKHPRRSEYGSSGPDDEGWESDDSSSSSSANSGLAFGDYDWRKGRSTESLASDASGTNKWFWRWGSKKPKKPILPPRPSASGIVPVVGGIAGAAAAAAPSTLPGRTGSAFSSMSSVPTLQSVYPVPTSDPNSFDAIRNSEYPIMTSRPENVPLQQPQPIMPVSGAVYETSPAYVAPTGPPVFSNVPVPESLPGRFVESPKHYQQSAVGEHRPQPRRRGNSSPILGSSKRDAALVGLAGAAVGAAIGASHSRKHSEPTSNGVQFDLTQEQHDREKRRERQREYGDDQKQRDRERERRRKEDEEYERKELERRDRAEAELRLQERERRAREQHETEEAERKALLARAEAEWNARRRKEEEQAEKMVAAAIAQADRVEREKKDKEEYEIRRLATERAEAERQAELERETERIRVQREREAAEAQERSISAQAVMERARREHEALAEERRRIERELYDDPPLRSNITGESDGKWEPERRGKELEEREKGVVRPTDWPVDAALAGAAGAAIGAIAASSTSKKSKRDKKKEKESRRAERPKFDDDDLPMEEVFDKDYFKKRDQEASKIVADIDQRYKETSPSPAEFFAPPELRSPSQSSPKMTPDADADIHVYPAHGPHIVLAPSAKMTEPPYEAPYSFTATPNSSKLKSLWSVPTLNLITPTPPGSTYASSIASGRSAPVSPVVAPADAKVETESKDVKSPTSKVTWGEPQTMIYEVQTPESYREQFMSDKDVAKHNRTPQAWDEIVVESYSPESGSKIRKYSQDEFHEANEHPRDSRKDQGRERDLEEATSSRTVGRNEKVYESHSPEVKPVVIEPRNSDIPSISSGFYQRPFFESVTDVGLAEEKPSVRHGFVEELEVETPPATQVVPHDTMPGGFIDDEATGDAETVWEKPLSKKEKKKLEKAKKRESVDSAAAVDTASSNARSVPEPAQSEASNFQEADWAMPTKKKGKKGKKAASEFSPPETPTESGNRWETASKTEPKEILEAVVADPTVAGVDEWDVPTRKTKKGKTVVYDPEPTSEPISTVVEATTPGEDEWDVPTKKDKKGKKAKRNSLQRDAGESESTTSYGDGVKLNGMGTIAAAAAGALAGAALGSEGPPKTEESFYDTQTSRTDDIRTSDRYASSGERVTTIPSNAFDDVEELADVKTPSKKAKRRSGKWSSPTGSPLRTEIGWDDYMSNQPLAYSPNPVVPVSAETIVEPEVKKEFSPERDDKSSTGKSDTYVEREKSKARRSGYDFYDNEDARSVKSERYDDDYDRKKHKSRTSKSEYGSDEESRRKEKHKRSSVISEPGDIYETSSKSKRRSKRDSVDFDDTASIASSPAGYGAGSSKKDKDKKGGGIFGLFSGSKSTESLLERSKSRSKDARDDDDGERRRKKKSSRSSTYGSDDEEDARSERREKRKSRDSKRDDSVDSKDYDVRSTTSDRRSKRLSRDEDDSFLGDRAVETARETIVPLPANAPVSPIARRPNRSDKQYEFHQYDELFRSPKEAENPLPELPTSRPTSPIEVGRVVDLPPLPTSRPGSPYEDELPFTPLSALRAASTTSVPFRLRRPPTSPSATRDRTSFISSSTASTPTTQDPSSPLFTTSRHGRSESAELKRRSAEFKASTEFRPLYLVERNRKFPDVEESLPTLPASRSPSVTEDGDRSDVWESAVEDHFDTSDELFHSPEGSRVGSGSRDSQEDYLDSQEVTPKATEFPREIHRMMDDQGSNVSDNRPLTPPPSYSDLFQTPPVHQHPVHAYHAGVEHDGFDPLPALHDAKGKEKQHAPSSAAHHAATAALLAGTTATLANTLHDSNASDKEKEKEPQLLPSAMPSDDADWSGLDDPSARDVAGTGVAKELRGWEEDDFMAGEPNEEDLHLASLTPAEPQQAEATEASPSRPAISRSTSKKGKKGKKGSKSGSISEEPTKPPTREDELAFRAQDAAFAVDSWFDEPSGPKEPVVLKGKKGKKGRISISEPSDGAADTSLVAEQPPLQPKSPIEPSEVTGTNTSSRDAIPSESDGSLPQTPATPTASMDNPLLFKRDKGKNSKKQKKKGSKGSNTIDDKPLTAETPAAEPILDAEQQVASQALPEPSTEESEKSGEPVNAEPKQEGEGDLRGPVPDQTPPRNAPPALLLRGQSDILPSPSWDTGAYGIDPEASFSPFTSPSQDRSALTKSGHVLAAQPDEGSVEKQGKDKKKKGKKTLSWSGWNQEEPAISPEAVETAVEEGQAIPKIQDPTTDELVQSTEPANIAVVTPEQAPVLPSEALIKPSSTAKTEDILTREAEPAPTSVQEAAEEKSSLAGRVWGVFGWGKKKSSPVSTAGSEKDDLKLEENISNESLNEETPAIGSKALEQFPPPEPAIDGIADVPEPLDSTVDPSVGIKPDDESTIVSKKDKKGKKSIAAAASQSSEIERVLEPSEISAHEAFIESEDVQEPPLSQQPAEEDWATPMKKGKKGKKSKSISAWEEPKTKSVPQESSVAAEIVETLPTQPIETVTPVEDAWTTSSTTKKGKKNKKGKGKLVILDEPDATAESKDIFGPEEYFDHEIKSPGEKLPSFGDDERGAAGAQNASIPSHGLQTGDELRDILPSDSVDVVSVISTNDAGDSTTVQMQPYQVVTAMDDEDYFTKPKKSKEGKGEKPFTLADNEDVPISDQETLPSTDIISESTADNRDPEPVTTVTSEELAINAETEAPATPLDEVAHPTEDEWLPMSKKKGKKGKKEKKASIAESPTQELPVQITTSEAERQIEEPSVLKADLHESTSQATEEPVISAEDEWALPDKKGKKRKTNKRVSFAEPDTPLEEVVAEPDEAAQNVVDAPLISDPVLDEAEQSSRPGEDVVPLADDEWAPTVKKGKKGKKSKRTSLVDPEVILTEIPTDANTLTRDVLDVTVPSESQEAVSQTDPAADESTVPIEVEWAMTPKKKKGKKAAKGQSVFEETKTPSETTQPRDSPIFEPAVVEPVELAEPIKTFETEAEDPQSNQASADVIDDEWAFSSKKKGKKGKKRSSVVEEPEAQTEEQSQDAIVLPNPDPISHETIEQAAAKDDYSDGQTQQREVPEEVEALADNDWAHPVSGKKDKKGKKGKRTSFAEFTSPADELRNDQSATGERPRGTSTVETEITNDLPLEATPANEDEWDLTSNKKGKKGKKNKRSSIMNNPDAIPVEQEPVAIPVDPPFPASEENDAANLIERDPSVPEDRVQPATVEDQWDVSSNRKDKEGKEEIADSTTAALTEEDHGKAAEHEAVETEHFEIAEPIGAPQSQLREDPTAPASDEWAVPSKKGKKGKKKKSGTSTPVEEVLNSSTVVERDDAKNAASGLDSSVDTEAISAIDPHDPGTVQVQEEPTISENKNDEWAFPISKGKGKKGKKGKQKPTIDTSTEETPNELTSSWQETPVEPLTDETSISAEQSEQSRGLMIDEPAAPADLDEWAMPSKKNGKKGKKSKRASIADTHAVDSIEPVTVPMPSIGPQENEMSTPSETPDQPVLPLDEPATITGEVQEHLNQANIEPELVAKSIDDPIPPIEEASTTPVADEWASFSKKTAKKGKKHKLASFFEPDAREPTPVTVTRAQESKEPAKAPEPAADLDAIVTNPLVTPTESTLVTEDVSIPELVEQPIEPIEEQESQPDDMWALPSKKKGKKGKMASSTSQIQGSIEDPPRDLTDVLVEPIAEYPLATDPAETTSNPVEGPADPAPVDNESAWGTSKKKGKKGKKNKHSSTPVETSTEEIPRDDFYDALEPSTAQEYELDTDVHDKKPLELTTPVPTTTDEEFSALPSKNKGKKGKKDKQGTPLAEPSIEEPSQDVPAATSYFDSVPATDRSLVLETSTKEESSTGQLEDEWALPSKKKNKKGKKGKASSGISTPIEEAPIAGSFTTPDITQPVDTVAVEETPVTIEMPTSTVEEDEWALPTSKKKGKKGKKDKRSSGISTSVEQIPESPAFDAPTPELQLSTSTDNGHTMTEEPTTQFMEPVPLSQFPAQGETLDQHIAHEMADQPEPDDSTQLVPPEASRDPLDANEKGTGISPAVASKSFPELPVEEAADDFWAPITKKSKKDKKAKRSSIKDKLPVFEPEEPAQEDPSTESKDALQIGEEAASDRQQPTSTQDLPGTIGETPSETVESSTFIPETSVGEDEWALPSKVKGKKGKKKTSISVVGPSAESGPADQPAIETLDSIKDEPSDDFWAVSTNKGKKDKKTRSGINTPPIISESEPVTDNTPVIEKEAEDLWGSTSKKGKKGKKSNKKAAASTHDTFEEPKSDLPRELAEPVIEDAYTGTQGKKSKKDKRKSDSAPWDEFQAEETAEPEAVETSGDIDPLESQDAKEDIFVTPGLESEAPFELQKDETPLETPFTDNEVFATPMEAPFKPLELEPQPANIESANQEARPASRSTKPPVRPSLLNPWGFIAQAISGVSSTKDDSMATTTEEHIDHSSVADPDPIPVNEARISDTPLDVQSKEKPVGTKPDLWSMTAHAISQPATKNEESSAIAPLESTEESAEPFVVKESKKDKKKAKRSQSIPAENDIIGSIPTDDPTRDVGTTPADPAHIGIEQQPSTQIEQSEPVALELPDPDSKEFSLKKSKKDKKKGKKGKAVLDDEPPLAETPAPIPEHFGEPQQVPAFDLSPSSFPSRPQPQSHTPSSDSAFALDPVPADRENDNIVPEEILENSQTNTENKPLTRKLSKKEKKKNAKNRAIAWSDADPEPVEEPVDTPLPNNDEPQSQSESFSAEVPADALVTSEYHDSAYQSQLIQDNQRGLESSINLLEKPIEGTDSAKFPSGDSQRPASPQTEVDFAASVAAGLEDSGFDPNLVIDDPAFIHRASPPLSGGEADPEELFTTTKRKGRKGKKSIQTDPMTTVLPVETPTPDEIKGTEPAQASDSAAFDAALTAGLAGAGFDPNIQVSRAPELDPEEEFVVPKKGKKGKKVKKNQTVEEEGDDTALESTTQTIPEDVKDSSLDIVENSRAVLGEDTSQDNTIAGDLPPQIKDDEPEDYWSFGGKKSKKGKKGKRQSSETETQDKSLTTVQEPKPISMIEPPVETHLIVQTPEHATAAATAYEISKVVDEPGESALPANEKEPEVEWDMPANKKGKKGKKGRKSEGMIWKPEPDLVAEDQAVKPDQEKDDFGVISHGAQPESVFESTRDKSFGTPSEVTEEPLVASHEKAFTDESWSSSKKKKAKEGKKSADDEETWISEPLTPDATVSDVQVPPVSMPISADDTTRPMSIEDPVIAEAWATSSKKSKKGKKGRKGTIESGSSTPNETAVATTPIVEPSYASEYNTPLTYEPEQDHTMTPSQPAEISTSSNTNSRNLQQVTTQDNFGEDDWALPSKKKGKKTKKEKMLVTEATPNEDSPELPIGQSSSKFRELPIEPVVTEERHKSTSVSDRSTDALVQKQEDESWEASSSKKKGKKGKQPRYSDNASEQLENITGAVAAAAGIATVVAAASSKHAESEHASKDIEEPYNVKGHAASSTPVRSRSPIAASTSRDVSHTSPEQRVSSGESQKSKVSGLFPGLERVKRRASTQPPLEKQPEEKRVHLAEAKLKPSSESRKRNGAYETLLDSTRGLPADSEPNWSFPSENRDSAVHVSDSPQILSAPVFHEPVRDSGYHDEPTSATHREMDRTVLTPIERAPAMDEAEWDLPVKKKRGSKGSKSMKESSALTETPLKKTSSAYKKSDVLVTAAGTVTPSSIDTKSKQRSSYLFESSPSLGDASPENSTKSARADHIETPTSQRTVRPSIEHQEHTKTTSTGHAPAAMSQPPSIFGDGSDNSQHSQQTPTRDEKAAGVPLATIREFSPDESPLSKKGRDVTDIGAPDRGVKSLRRTGTPQRMSLERVQPGQDVPDVGGEVSPRAASIARHRTPEQIRSLSRASIGSNRSSTPPLRRVDRSQSGDLRQAAKLGIAALISAQQTRATTDSSAASASATSGPSTYDPSRDKGKARAADMSDVLEGWGGRPGSPLSPTRPASVRKRQSLQILDLESRAETLAAENRQLQEARIRAEEALQNATYQRDVDTQLAHGSMEARDREIAQKDAELAQIQQALRTLQEEVTRLTGVNEQLQEANQHLTADTNERYATLQSEGAEAHQNWQNSLRELEQLRSQHSQFSSNMEDVVRAEIAAALAEKNAEIDRLQDELDAATEQIKTLKRQILTSKQGDSFLTVRDEDYFDSACQQLCSHVQQWVLRFSKISDKFACRLSSELRDEKLESRLDNAILDGTDVDMLLADRVKRRDVFMSVVMTMIWEYVFTRYLFGMDREQRQKLKALEKTLQDVGPARAVAKWRAITLTLLAKRDAFQQQRAQDTEAVMQEIYASLASLLPPPSHYGTQLQDSLRNVLRLAITLSVEMRTQRAEYIMLPPLQPDYDANGDLIQKVFFNASLMNERSGDTTSNEELERKGSVVKMVLFPLVVKKGDDDGEGEDEIVVCPAQVLVAKAKGDGKKVVRVMSGAMDIDEPVRKHANRSVQSISMLDGGSGI